MKGEDAETAMSKKLAPVHPGEILIADFLKPLGISQAQLARFIGVAPRRIYDIVGGKKRISADVALRLGRCFGMETLFWLNLQAHYDLEIVRERIADDLRKIRPHFALSVERPRPSMNGVRKKGRQA